MLDALLCLDGGIDFGGSGSCGNVSLVRDSGIFSIENLPAAAAASAGSLFAASGGALSEVLGSGLLLRRLSCLTAGGERERLSNLEARFGSGSFWSKRERFEARLSVSSIFSIAICKTIRLKNARSWEFPGA